MNIYSLLFRILSGLPKSIQKTIGIMLAWILKNIIKYRLRIIKQNINIVYPSWSDDKKQALINNYYKHLGQLFIESLEGLKSKDYFLDKYKVLNKELLEVEEGDNLIVLCAHIDNWENLAVVLPLHIKNKALVIYKRIKNRAVETALTKIRQSHGTKMIEMKDSVKYMLTQDKWTMAVLADQNPAKKSSLQLPFFGINTHFTSIPFKIAQKRKIKMIFACVVIENNQKTIVLEKISDKPQLETTKELINKYIALLEKYIHKQPELWLWSHKRWKHEINYN